MPMRIALWITIALIAAGVVSATRRVVRVHHATGALPVYPGALEGPRHTRYWPRLLSWDDRSSARVDRIFAVPAGTTLLAIGHHAADWLAGQGWYPVTPTDLAGTQDPQVIVWQRDPDERLDLSQLWPVSGMSRTQRLYGGTFPEAFLDAPVVIGWTWALGGPRSPHPPVSPPHSIVRTPPAPPRAPDTLPRPRF
jgi:hypothetical protein